MRLVLLLLGASIVSGCSHYQLGTGAKSPLAFHTLYVAPVANKSLLPQAQAIVSERVRDAFARDGRVALAAAGDAADATLEVTLTDYHREVAAARAGDTGLARKFNLILTASCTLRDHRAGKVLFENRTVSTSLEAFTDQGQLQAEYEAVPLLASALADKITHAALDTW